MSAGFYSLCIIVGASCSLTLDEKVAIWRGLEDEDNT